MVLTYFRRYRMEIDLRERDLVAPPVPRGYLLLPWNKSLLDAHAEVKYLSFCNEIDANVFPCLGELTGCRRLMSEITRKGGFLERATWLAVTDATDVRQREKCGTIQGIRDREGVGAVQNLGIAPAYRDRGLGSILLLRALQGFRESGVHRVCLEVTAENEGAIRLYERHGFRTVKTVFKVAEVAYS
ncbi:MAG: GNAT family N-acetyltransferase [Planctomycetaceae bacterium]|nr:GNAT family N-acetyltransferase [Planctomycetaceae bacterium]